MEENRPLGNKPNLKLNDLNLSNPGDLFLGQDKNSAMDKFVERGDSPEDLILRSDFMDFDQGTAWCRQLRKARHFHDNEEEQMLINYLAMLPAVQGKRIDILKDAVIGKHSQDNRQGFAYKLREKLGMNDKNDNNNG